MISSNRMIFPAAAGLLMAILFGSRMHAQTEPQTAVPAADGMEQALAHVQKLLDESDYFYKTVTDASGEKYFVVLYENADGKSQICIDVNEVGTVDGQKVYSYMAYVSVAQAAEGESLPPGVIKLVASENNSTMIGYFCMSKDFRAVYSTATGVIDGLNRTALRMTLLYLHSNKASLAKAIEPILKEANS